MFFKDIVGHTELKSKFIKDINENKLPHAHLFLGKLGYGGLPLTLAIIQYLMCENRLENDSCGECHSCKMIQRLEHPDLHFSFPTVQALSQKSDPQFPLWKAMVKENPFANLNEWINYSDDKGRNPTISVHQSNEIVKKLTLKSFEGGYKVSVIWMAEEMNQTCANKLLKIIEEPPQKTLFILLAESEDAILPTILSRTQITKIKQLKREELSAYLQKEKNVSGDLTESVVARSEGNIRLALELLKLNNKENIDFQRFVELMRVCYKKDVIAMMDWAEGMAMLGREEQKIFLKYGLYLMRQSIMKNFTEGKLMNASAAEEQFLQNFARFITGNNIIEFNELFSNAHYGIERNANAKLLFTNITFEVMRYIRSA